MSDRIELTKEKFGAAAMCPQCASPWASTKHKTRIASGIKFSGRMNTLICGTHDSLRVSKYLQTLMQKYKRNRVNKIMKMCSVCSGIVKLTLSKPQRHKISKSNNLSRSFNLSISSKKNKKHAKDKTAGLNVSGIKMSDAYLCPTASILENKGIYRIQQRDIPKPVSKSKKIDLSKLTGIIDSTVKLSKKNKMHTFLQELG